MRAADALAIVASGLLAIFWRFESTPPELVFTPMIIGSLLAANTLPMMRLYRASQLGSLSYQIPRVLAGWSLAIAVLIAVLFAFKTAHEVSRLWVTIWLVTGSMALIANRFVLRLALLRGEAAASLVRRTAVVGLGEHLPEMLRRLADAPEEVQVSAVLDLDGTLLGRWPRGALSLRGFADLAERVYRGELDSVVLAMPARSSGLLEGALRSLRHLPVDVSWAPELPAQSVPIIGVAEIADVPIVRLTKRPLDGWHYVMKALEDRILASMILIMVAPVMAAIALLVKLDSPGPVFYRQNRHGFSKQPVGMLKFRSMYVDMCDAADARSVRQATNGDPRVTRIGRILRRTSLDELPQLINVLKGEMSLVGPRPHAVAHDHYYADLIDDYLGRHRVKPGMTGWAQVNGCRGETRDVNDMRRRIELDLEYIDQWSILFDFRILWRTVFTGFYSKQAY